MGDDVVLSVAMQNGDGVMLNGNAVGLTAAMLKSRHPTSWVKGRGCGDGVSG